MFLKLIKISWDKKIEKNVQKTPYSKFLCEFVKFERKVVQEKMKKWRSNCFSICLSWKVWFESSNDNNWLYFCNILFQMNKWNIFAMIACHVKSFLLSAYRIWIFWLLKIGSWDLHVWKCKKWNDNVLFWRMRAFCGKSNPLLQTTSYLSTYTP